MTVMLGGCIIAWQDNFSYSYGSATPCSKTMEWCIFEVPQLGYMGVKADGGVGTEYTNLALRLAPRPGVTAAWSAREVRLIDLDSNATKDMAVLETKRVLGGDPTPAVPTAGPNLVFHGGYSPADFSLRTRIKRFELRFPPVVVGESQLQVPPVQITDGARFPMPVPIFMAGH
jgi:hypothetical protein